MDNYINLNRKDENQSIYRIVTIERLLEMFDSKVNTLVKPYLWDDPFENCICASPFRTKSGKIYKFPLRDRGYGQCWSLKSESDAMWRIYARQKDGVKIQTTIRKLYISLIYAPTKNLPHMACYIGKVEYYTQEELERLVNDPEKMREVMNSDNSINKGQARTLLIKRKQFEHESEVRLIYLDPGNRGGSDIFQYPCDPYTLIKGISFHPRMDLARFESYKSALVLKGYQGKIDQSKLYSKPDLTIEYEG